MTRHPVTQFSKLKGYQSAFLSTTREWLPTVFPSSSHNILPYSLIADMQKLCIWIKSYSIYETKVMYT